MGGVLMVSGTTFRLDRIVLPLDGSPPPPLAYSLAFDLWHHWLQIAVEEEHRALVARAGLVQSAPEDRGQLVVPELQASLSSITACAFSVDGFYGGVADRVALPRRGRASRAKRIAEGLKQSFKMSNDSFVGVRSRLIQLFSHFRDSAVHPTGEFAEAFLHPVIGSGVARPVLAFSAPNSEAVVSFTLMLLEHCVEHPKPQHRELRKWVDAYTTPMAELKALRARLAGERGGAQ